MGGITILVLVIGTVAGFLLIKRAYHAIWAVLSASLGGLLMSILLKGYYRRPRPDLVPHLVDAGLSSFPSGHTMNSAVVYPFDGDVEPRRPADGDADLDV